MDYKRKIDFAIKLLRSIPQDGPIELSYSGGKDSDIILELAKMSGIPFEAIYKNTTIDPPGTIAHCRENGVTIIHPKKSMFQIIEEKGWPTRRARFCCSELKEYKIHDRAIQGIRRCESRARANRYTEPEQCRVYKKGEKVRVYYPILEWTDEDVERFISDRHIKCAPVYYDDNGKFHVERRLGCIGCPMRSDCGKAVAYGELLPFIDSLPEETSCIYDTNELTPTPSVNIEDVARVQFASHAHVFDRKRKAVFDWEQFKEVAGIFYGFGKRGSLPEDTVIFQKGVAEGRRLEREDGLAWRDIRRIVKIADDLLDDPKARVEFQNHNEGYYYKRVLDEYNRLHKTKEE